MNIVKAMHGWVISLFATIRSLLQNGNNSGSTSDATNKNNNSNAIGTAKNNTSTRTTTNTSNTSTSTSTTTSTSNSGTGTHTATRISFEDIRRVLIGLWNFFDRIGTGIIRCMIIGLILNVVAKNFYPELTERFPIIYGWFDGCMQLGEFAVKSALGWLYALFHGEGSNFYHEISTNFEELLNQFATWLSMIHF